MLQRLPVRFAAPFLLAMTVLAGDGLGQALQSPPDQTPPPSPETVKMWREEAEQIQAHIHAKWNVSIDLQMVVMEEAKALELIPEFRSSDERAVAAAWERLQEMIKAKEVTLLAWPMVRTVDGARAVSETILEKRYSTEFEPPQQPQTFAVGPPPPKPGKVNDATVDGLPIAYETRNVGATLEVEPQVLNEGKRVYLRLVPWRTELTKMEAYNHVLTVHNTLITVPQPLFRYEKSDLNLSVRSGERQLIAVHKLANSANLMELQLVRAVITTAE